MKDVQAVAEIVIDVLKELSAEHQPLTPHSLGKSLGSRRQFLDLLSPLAPAHAAKGSGAVSAQQIKQEEQIQELKSQVRNLRDQHQRLQRQSASNEEQSSRRRELYKKSALMLLILARNTDAQALLPSLDHLRSLIVEEAEPEILEECLGKIRGIVMKESPTSGHSEEKAAWQTEVALKPEPDGPRNDEFLEQMQRAFSKILSRFQSVARDEHRARCSELERLIRSAGDVDALLAVGDALGELIEAYVSRAAEEHNRVASFAKELGRSLLQMESQLVLSFEDARDAFHSNTIFNRSLHGDMSKIEESFGQTTNLEEARKFVLSRLTAIKGAIDNKVKQDETRFQASQTKMEELQKNLADMKGEITAMQQRTKALEQEALLDALTGIHNRRAWEKRIREELDRYHRYNQIFSLILFDVDHFKRLNDEYGHRAGDKCLKEVVNRVKNNIRSTDFLARYGGEEFVVALPGVGKENACKAAEKIRAIVEKTRFRYQGIEIRVTISLGVTDVQPTDKEPGVLFNRVDAAMYQAKKEGRNRVCIGECGCA